MYGDGNRLTGFPGKGPGDRARKRASVPAPSREAAVGIATGGAVPPRDLDGRGTVRSIRIIDDEKKYGASRLGSATMHRRKVSRSPLKEDETEEREGEFEETVGADERAGKV